MKLSGSQYIILFAALFCLVPGKNATCQPPLLPAAYYPDGNCIVGSNKDRYNNRPLYCDNSSTFILTGDKPLIRLVQSPFIAGSFGLYFIRDGSGKWVGDFSNILSKHEANKMRWIISDSAYKHLLIQFEVVPLSGAKGMALHVVIKGNVDDDQLMWTYGGVEFRKSRNLSWDLDIAGNLDVIKWKSGCSTCTDNKIIINDDHLILQPSDSMLTQSGTNMMVTGTFPSVSATTIEHEDEERYPVASGLIDLPRLPTEYYWAFEILNDAAGRRQYSNPKQAWDAGNLLAGQLSKRITVRSPDKRLNALASISSSVINALWYDSAYLHGAMLWNVPFPGWRSIYGGTVYGWHERVKTEANYYINSQIQKSDKVNAKADTALLMTAQDTGSRFYGAGRIIKDQKFYNFQSMFFDQLICEWRAAADPHLEKILMKALSLHLQWQRDCFDPDGDGLYESYINSWPSDSQWYNGGGSAEETSYAFRGHVAMREITLRARDTAAHRFHDSMVKKIQKAFEQKLWIRSKGHAGSYLEQGGYQRLHTDPWLYSIFLPIDAGLVDRLKAISSLYYTKSTLQNDPMPLGGRQVWASNWVPGIWSVRERYAGDNYHLALAYFLSGMGDDGWDIFKGTFLETAFNGYVPGNLGAGSGTDFADCAHMFARTLVEGLFGYRPDYPKGKVIVAPTFPRDWVSASINVPDYSFQFKKNYGSASFDISLARAANMDVYFPLPFKNISTVTVNNKRVKWQLLPGIGSSVLYIRLHRGSKAVIIVQGKNPHPVYDEKLIAKNAGDSIRIQIKDASVISISDEEGVLKSYNIKDGSLAGVVSSNIGNHTLFVKAVRDGKYPEMHPCYISIKDGDNKTNTPTATVTIQNAAEWDYVNIDNRLNADVRTIYQQKYISPRPNTVSVRIGTDGYSPWTFPYWKNRPPDILLDSIPFLKNNADSLIRTGQGVSFLWPGGDKNIAFASLWDNWPDSIQFHVNRSGDAIHFLVCGSTNPMQCNIANAVIRLKYADDSYDSIMLVPPVNYWNLSPINALPSAPGQPTRNDYTAVTDSFCLPERLPETVQLGRSCRAMLISAHLKKGIKLDSVHLVALSQEVVVGMIGITVMHNRKQLAHHNSNQ